MRLDFALIVIASIFSNPLVIPIAILILALVVGLGGFFLLRSSGKSKKRANAAASNSADWQKQGQGAAPGWNQQAGMVNPSDSPWGQGAQGAQPGGWGAQNASQQQAGWGAQNPAQQPGGWNSQSGSQQPAGWGTQNPAQQQQQPAGWGAPNSDQQQAGWGAQNPDQQQAGWGAQSPAQQQQPAGWGAQSPAQQQQPAGWGSQGTQDPWAQPVPQAQQQGAAGWGANSTAPAQPPQGPSGFGASSTPAWGQQSQPADPWSQGQPAQQQPQWAAPQAAPSQSQPGGFMGQIPSTPASNNSPVASWQQPGTGQQGFGNQGMGAPGMQQDMTAPPSFGDADKTVLRSTGSQPLGQGTGQGRVGIVRVEEGKEPGRVYEVRKESLSIGRSRESDIFLEDLAVSRLHASIVNMGNGSYALKDEGSANGTKVNGQMVNKYQTYPLQEGDKIQLGQTVLVFAKR